MFRRTLLNTFLCIYEDSLSIWSLRLILLLYFDVYFCFLICWFVSVSSYHDSFLLYSILDPLFLQIALNHRFEFKLCGLDRSKVSWCLCF